MSLIEKEIERRKGLSFKGKLSKGFEKAKCSAKREYDKVKTEFKEKKRFNQKLKQTEKAEYKKALFKEAKRSGRRKARQRYSPKKRKSKIKLSLGAPGTPGFMELPGKKKGKGEKTAFDW